MPLPKPKSGETVEDFTSRAHEELAGEYPDRKQRHAVILSQWAKAKDLRKARNSENRHSILAQLALGTQEEMEHTDNPLEAMKIAVDHLLEDQDYYVKLEAAGLVDKAKAVEGFESPEPGDLSDKLKGILAKVYAHFRKKGYSKERAAKIAWGAIGRITEAATAEDVTREGEPV
jgi:hypothetical protein